MRPDVETGRDTMGEVSVSVRASQPSSAYRWLCFREHSSLIRGMLLFEEIFSRIWVENREVYLQLLPDLVVLNQFGL